MKYFYDQIVNFAFDDEKLLKKQTEIYHEQYLAYKEEFDRCKDKLSEGVLRFCKSKPDTCVFNTNIIYKQVGIDIAIQLRHSFNTILQNERIERVLFDGFLMHYDVSEFRANMLSVRSPVHRASWVESYKHGELLLEEDGLWVHNFLIHPVPNEIYIKCKRIEWIDKEDYKAESVITT